MNCVNELLKAFDKDIELEPYNKLNDKIYHSIGCSFAKKWIANILPYELLELDIKDTINLIMTLSEGDNFYKHFPDIIKTPDYGDNWGRFANYTEINNRSIAKMYDKYTCCGIINSIKLLPSIPPSAKSWAHCIVLSQIFPNIFGDGYNKDTSEENSIYCFKLNSGYSKNIIDNCLDISPEKQIQAFNTLAHFRGIKTGFRTLISAGQIKVVINNKEQDFDWNNKEHVEIYINEHVKLVNLGFEAIFVDSAKHIGGYDMQNYTGVGELPSYNQAQYIFYEIRRRSGCNTISFPGEKSTGDFERYENMGLTCGTDYITGDNFYDVRNLSEQFKYNRNYAPGVEIENDNYYGGMSFEQRLNRINNALFGFYHASDKLPSFMQMNDIFPLNDQTNTHHIMLFNPNFSTDETQNNHHKNLFKDSEGRLYNHNAGVIFANALCL
ncbi:MAG: hypothetical protein IJ877_00915 [Candidatus Gastranaerophilales bacterium]|nr:hypothetical protein [Candidatus Gastranaerophilales bacterium]